jgi:SAM-dependent methyltransferase
MPTEAERIEAAYQGYRESQAAQARWSHENPGNRAILHERTRKLKQLLRTGGFLPLDGRRILDVGCGSGQVLASLTQWGAEPGALYGIDLLPDRVADAQRRYPEIQFRQANAERLGFPDGAFDLVFLFTLFTSILDDQMAHSVAGEVTRVLKPQGAIVWYDFRVDNPRNPNVRGMPRPSIVALFPGLEFRSQSLTLLPPLARRLGSLTDLLYPVLGAIPFLRTHYLGLLIKP